MRTTSRRISLGAALGLIAAALLLLVAVVFRQGTASLLMRVAAPVLSLRAALGAGEVAQLRAELASTSAALADRDLLYAENQQLRAELGRSEGVHEILAGVLQRPPGTPYDTFIIDAGRAQGIAVGSAVRVGGAAVGAVDALYSNTARVTLYSAPGQQYQALIQTPAGSLPVSVEGQGGGSMRALVPAATAVAVGDSVVLPGVAGALIAKVSAVEPGAGDSSKTVYLHLPFNLFDVRFVYIEKP